MEKQIDLNYFMTLSFLICLLLISFSKTGWCGKIIYPWNATTTIVKAGDSFTVWFDADKGQSVTSVKLRGSYNTVHTSMITQTGSWEYDAISGNIYNRQIIVTVPDDAPADRYDLVLSTSTGEEVSLRAVKVIKEYKSEYTIMHISDTHLGQRAIINGHPENLVKISAMVDFANIIDPEMVFITGDLLNDKNFTPQERADFLYEGYKPADLNGLNGFKPATFSIVGNHDYLESLQTPDSTHKEKSEFWNKYHGLQNHRFKYGNNRFMVINNGWHNFDFDYQLTDHASWLAEVGTGDLRIAAYHNRRIEKMEIWADSANIDLVMVGHNHHIADGNPYEMNGKPIVYIVNSIRDHFPFNLYRVQSDGSYTVVNNEELVENPSDPPDEWRPKLTLSYSNANDGTSLSNTATFSNKFDLDFPRAHVRFAMPKGIYEVSKGNIEQCIETDSMSVIDVCVALDNNSITEVEINAPSPVGE